jgi:hypothetical protein
MTDRYQAHVRRGTRLQTRDGYAPGDRFKRIFVMLIAGLFGAVVLDGCKAFEIRTQSNSLSDNGFIARVPETPRQREAYAALPPYRLFRSTAGGNVFYVYKNEKAGVVYLGNEEDYQRYMRQVRRLVAFYETTEDKMRAYDMESNVQAHWTAPWGNP